MIIDNNILEKLETLSMLKIDKSKETQTKKELTSIINYIDNLNDLENVKIENKNIDKSRTLLEDKNKNSSEIMNNISNQSNTISDNFFIVPRVIKN